ncbi:hypothetical protein ACH4RG_22655 [Streptomyces sp. NPDC021019]|uniref:hypothetical protein n=1 Tax=Streptomyces sp. NPDC021019 TaxID=3365108 RepID=UPI0037A3EBB1
MYPVRQAEAYARTCARLCAHPAAALLDAAGAGAGSRVLDVGSGSGTVSFLAGGRDTRVYAGTTPAGRS